MIEVPITDYEAIGDVEHEVLVLDGAEDGYGPALRAH